MEHEAATIFVLSVVLGFERIIENEKEGIGFKSKKKERVLGF